MNRGIIRVSLDLLAQALRLPEGTRIDDVLQPDEARLTRVVHVVVSGNEGLPEVGEAQTPPFVEVEIVRPPEGLREFSRYRR